MQTLPIKSTVLIDITPYAIALEQAASGALLPYPAGYYDKLSLTPVLVPGQLYYKRAATPMTRLDPFVFSSLDQITHDVYDVHGKRLFAYQFKKNLTLDPQLPIHGIGMCLEVVNDVIDTSRAWLNRSPARVSSLWRDFFVPEVHVMVREITENGVEAAMKGETEEHLARIHEHITPLIRTVRDFIGTDPWVIYLAHCEGSDLVLERSMDWRAYDWAVRMEARDWP